MQAPVLEFPEDVQRKAKVLVTTPHLRDLLSEDVTKGLTPQGTDVPQFTQRPVILNPKA